MSHRRPRNIFKYIFHITIHKVGLPNDWLGKGLTVFSCTHWDRGCGLHLVRDGGHRAETGAGLALTWPSDCRGWPRLRQHKSLLYSGSPLAVLCCLRTQPILFAIQVSLSLKWGGLARSGVLLILGTHTDLLEIGTHAQDKYIQNIYFRSAQRAPEALLCSPKIHEVQVKKPLNKWYLQNIHTHKCIGLNIYIQGLWNHLNQIYFCTENF